MPSTAAIAGHGIAELPTFLVGPDIGAGRLAVVLPEYPPTQLAPGRIAWVQVAAGAGAINGLPLAAGDGVAVETAGGLTLTGTEAAEILLFDMAP